VEPSLKFLHLEDDINDVELAQATLAAEGIECTMVIAGDGDQFVAALEEGGFDLIISDYALPSFDGMTALALTREKHPHLPFIFLSGQMGEEFAIESLKRGATDYVLKARLSRLAPAVRRALQEDKERLAHLQAEKTLQESEERYRSLFDNSIDAILLTKPDGRILAANPEACRIFGSTEEELCRIGRERVVAADDSKVQAALEERTRTGRFRGEISLCRKDGTSFPGEISTVIYRDSAGNDKTSMIIRDITARRATEEALRQFSKVVEQSPVCIIITDTTGAIEYVNPKFYEVTGYSMEDVVGQNPRILKSGETSSEIYKTMWETISKGETWQGVLHNRKKNGELYWEAATISPLRNIDGVITKYFAIKEDITERKILEGQLQQAQKLEAVGQLAGGVAHDFNNMLGVIMGYAELALMKMAPSEPVYANLCEIRTAAERSADLTRQLLAFARKQTIAPKVIALNETVSGMLKMLKRLIGEDMHLAWHQAPDLWLVKVDPSQVDQMLANLCVNARDAITDVGRITIETGNIIIDANYCATHAYVEPGEYVRLIVSDDGVGMDKETLTHIFEPFFTTKRVGQGTGLGLSTVYGIVRQNKGFINVYSEPGQGTTFTIYLPRHMGENGEAVKEAAAESAPRGNEMVLLVEDELTILKMADLMLEGLGYTVLTAGTAAEAIRLFREQSGKIRLLMTDVVMPDMNGRDLARELRSINPRLNCLFMSGYTANVIAHHGVLDEGVHFIQKPFSLSDLANKVREALDGK
jgi:PAS domain S-box-containing protein